MKHLFKYTLCIGLVAFLFSGQLYSQDYEGFVTLRGGELVERNDSLCISFVIDIDSKAVPSCGTVIFEPELTDGNTVVALPYIQLNGRARANLNRRWLTICSDEWLSHYNPPRFQVDVNKYTRDSLNYTINLPYEPWMGDARLYLKHELVGCRGKSWLYTYAIQNNVSVSTPYEVQPMVTLLAPTDQVKNRSRQGSAYLDFPVNRSQILPDFRRNPEELAKINDALAGVSYDSDITLKGIMLEGFASPEAPYAHNDKLARERVQALKNYLSQRYSFSNEIFQIRWTAEDWDGLKQLVSQSSMAYKDEVLAIINSGEDYDVREARLKRLAGGVPYAKMLREMFPDLRRVEYRIDYLVRNYNLTEAREIIKTHPENLSQIEMYNVAMEYGENSPEYKNIIIETIPKYFSEDGTALSNAAALLIQNKEFQTARRLLEKAPQTPAVWNNLGVIYLCQGDYDKAAELLSQAATAGIQEAGHNMKELNKKRENDKKLKK